MSTQQNMEDRLWEYIDGTCPAEERSFLEQLIATNQEWKTKYKELLEVHQLLGNHIELDEPSMRFTQNVMEQISKLQITPAAKSYINKKVIWGIGIFFILSIVGLLIYSFGQVTSSGSGDNILPTVNFNKVNFSKLLNNTYTNIFIMVDIVLGLMMLDMYLGKKKQQLRENSHRIQ